jgi:hypothetical protein
MVILFRDITRRGGSIACLGGLFYLLDGKYTHAVESGCAFFHSTRKRIGARGVTNAPVLAPFRPRSLQLRVF